MQRIIIFLLSSLLILSSCKLIEDTTEPEGGKVTSKITVISPNGGESLMEGSSYEIKWSGTTSSLLKIHFSVDNGSTWKVVADSLSNTGIYIWFPVPNLISNQCKIKIMSLDGTASDESDQVFSIIKNSNESLRITAPIGNESWEAGTSQKITWYSAGLDSVRIEYTTNNGNQWNFIAIDKRNTGIYYWEPVPNTPSTLAKIRIKDAKDGVPAAESPSPFSILPEPKIKVIFPNGGETFYTGSNVKIEWISENIPNVKIAYTTNNGSDWNTIVESTPSVGYYLWTQIPNVNSQLCKVRVYDAKDGEPNDVSDNTFTIKPGSSQNIIVRVPNGGENWEAGSAKQITWYSSEVDSVILEYTIDNGNNWLYIAKDKKNTGIYFWDPIPKTPSTLAKIRIKDASDGLPVDESDATFNILPEPIIKVVTPNGGERWLSGSDQKIEWVSENIENVKIAYTTNNGFSWTTIIESTPSIGFYTWNNVPSLNSQLCKIKIMDANDGYPSDVSDQPFTITNQVVQSITVTSPNGGEVWEANTSQTITWISTGISNLKIEYTLNNGSTWNTITNSVQNSGSYLWDVPNSPSTQCKIRISDAADGVPVDESNNTFTINPAASITLISPNGNEVWRAGQTHSIVWQSTNIQNVKIEYTINNGIREEDWNLLVASTPATAGSYPVSFTVPSTEYKVRVSDAVDGSPMAMSAGTFTVLPKASITVVRPNGGEQWLTGQTYEIQWTSTNVAKVKIEYTLNEGIGWNTIITNLTNGGSYLWTVPVTVEFGSDLCKIKVSEYNELDPTAKGAFDVSDNFFSINPRFLRIIAPNGGEDWTKSTVYRIEWASGGVSRVKLEYTLNNGQTWITINNNYESTGAYDWLTPGVVSNNARVRITDVSDPTLTDQSDGTFKITAQAAFITIDSPLQNDSWSIGIQRDILWNNSNEITSVVLDYSIDNGNTWINITTVLSPGNIQNKYTWTIPNAPTDYARIRISGTGAYSGVITLSRIFKIVP